MQKQKKLMSGYQEKLLSDRQTGGRAGGTDGRTDNDNFIRPSVYGGPTLHF